VVVIVLVVKVRDMDVRDVNFRVVDVGVLVVWIVVVVDGHPRASCSQHHAFQSGDQARSATPMYMKVEHRALHDQ